MRGHKKGLAALALTLCLAAVALVFAATPWAGSTGGQHATAQLKAAWIYVGPHNDGGWSQAHDKGRQYVQKHLGSKVKTTYKENVARGPADVPGDREPRPRREQDHLRDLVRLPAVRWSAAAKKYPDVHFEQATGTAQSKNLAEYFGAGEDAIYLSGMAAGAATKKGTIGYVVPFAIPEVIRHANAFALGAQATHPGVKVKLDLDEQLVRAGQGEEGGREPRRRRRRRARAERRQPGDRAVRQSKGSRGSATTRTRRSSRRSRG